MYEDMDESLILKTAMLTKCGSGPSGHDAHGWRKILTSRWFETASSTCARHLHCLSKDPA